MTAPYDDTEPRPQFIPRLSLWPVPNDREQSITLILSTLDSHAEFDEHRRHHRFSGPWLTLNDRLSRFRRDHTAADGTPFDKAEAYRQYARLHAQPSSAVDPVNKPPPSASAIRDRKRRKELRKSRMEAGSDVIQPYPVTPAAAFVDPCTTPPPLPTAARSSSAEPPLTEPRSPSPTTVERVISRPKSSTGQPEPRLDEEDEPSEVRHPQKRQRRNEPIPRRSPPSDEPFSNCPSSPQPAGHSSAVDVQSVHGTSSSSSSSSSSTSSYGKGHGSKEQVQSTSSQPLRAGRGPPLSQAEGASGNVQHPEERSRSLEASGTNTSLSVDTGTPSAPFEEGGQSPSAQVSQRVQPKPRKGSQIPGDAAQNSSPSTPAPDSADDVAWEAFRKEVFTALASPQSGVPLPSTVGTKKWDETGRSSVVSALRRGGLADGDPERKNLSTQEYMQSWHSLFENKTTKPFTDVVIAINKTQPLTRSFVEAVTMELSKSSSSGRRLCYVITGTMNRKRMVSTHTYLYPTNTKPLDGDHFCILLQYIATDKRSRFVTLAVGKTTSWKVLSPMFRRIEKLKSRTVKKAGSASASSLRELPGQQPLMEEGKESDG